MKKVVSLILALVMVFALATTASAANVVGTHGANADTNNSLSDGVADFTSNALDPNATIAIKVGTGSVQSRYAVDLVYDAMTLSLYGDDVVWDVNELEYVKADGSSAAGGIQASNTFEITINNYSDKPVYFAATAADPNDDVDGLELEVTANGSVDAATPKAGVVPGSAGTKTITVTVTANVEKAKAYYAERLTGSDDTETVGTVSVTISKTNP